jgi:hypothetical protein
MDDLQECIRQLHHEAAGVLNIYSFTPEQSEDLLAAALLGGDATALRLMAPVVNTVAQICGASPDEPWLCMCCPSPARRWGTIVLVLPHCGDPTQAIGSGLCARCAALPSARLSELIQDAVRRIWPHATTIGRVSVGPEAVQ